MTIGRTGRKTSLSNLRSRRNQQCSDCGITFKASATTHNARGEEVSQCPSCYEKLVQSARKRPNLRVVGPPRPSLLIVDDDPIIRTLLRMFFEPLVRDFHEATSGREALEIAAEQKPDVIICDNWMPVMGGDETVRELRELVPDARIVSFSGSDVEKPWADETVIKGSHDDLERLKRAVFPENR